MNVFFILKSVASIVLNLEQEMNFMWQSNLGLTNRKIHLKICGK